MHRAALDFKVGSGWSPRHAQAHTLISSCGVTAIARALREGDPVYAASTHAIYEALASRAREMTLDGTHSDAVAPLSYCNLRGTFGLISEDATWGHLTPDSRVGMRFTTYAIVATTANAKCFPTGGGFAVPMANRDASGKPEIEFRTQNSPVVCFVSRATARPSLDDESRSSQAEWQRAMSKKRHQDSMHHATGHSLIHSSGSSYELPPLASVVLEQVVPAGEWSVYGHEMQQLLYVVGVSFDVSMDATLDARASPGKASSSESGQGVAYAELASRKFAVRFLIDMLKQDEELTDLSAAIDDCEWRHENGELTREELLRELGRVVGFPKLVEALESSGLHA